MRIWEDDYYVKDSDREDFISHGLAFASVYHLRFQYVTTPESDDERPVRSQKMFRIMEKIAEKFPTYQFREDENKIPYSSDKWALFFWCNGAKFDGVYQDDYTYFTLGLNKDYHTRERQKEVLESLLAFLRENFSDLDYLDVAVQLDTHYDDGKIASEAARVKPLLDGVRCSWHDMDGKIVTTDRGTFFVKKYSSAKKEIENGQFFTPAPLCRFIMEALHLTDTDVIADLTCGAGAFFNFAPVEGNVYGCELDAKAYKIAHYLYPNANLTCGDIRHTVRQSRIG